MWPHSTATAKPGTHQSCNPCRHVSGRLRLCVGPTPPGAAHTRMCCTPQALHQQPLLWTPALLAHLAAALPRVCRLQQLASHRRCHIHAWDPRAYQSGGHCKLSPNTNGAPAFCTSSPPSLMTNQPMVTCPALSLSPLLFLVHTRCNLLRTGVPSQQRKASHSAATQSSAKLAHTAQRGQGHSPLCVHHTGLPKRSVPAPLVSSQCQLATSHSLLHKQSQEREQDGLHARLNHTPRTWDHL